MVAHETIRFTTADYRKLPEDLRVELIHGELVKDASPTAWHQLLDHGVSEVWLVDPAPRTVRVCSPGRARTYRGASRAPSRVVQGFAIVPDELFRE